MNYRKIFYFLVSAMSISSASQAQFSINTGENNLEIGGRLSIYGNYRFLKPGETNQKNNLYKVRDAIIDIHGRHGSNWQYRLQADIADLAAGTTGDPENPGLMNANITYTGISHLNIMAGYGKLPYSYQSMESFVSMPYWQRSQIARGEFFSRRDVGVTLTGSMWNDRVKLYGGMYTGQGELSMKGDNDASGSPEFIGRAEISYPYASKHVEVDYEHTPIPIVSLGVNGRYADKKLPNGKSFDADELGDYNLRVVNGKKYTYGMDAVVRYQGLSGFFEIDQVKAMPQNPNDPLFQGYTMAQTKGKVFAGGMVTELNYNVRSSGTTVSARYEELDVNDLVPGNSKRWGAAVDQKLSGINGSLRLQYFHIMNDESIDPNKWKDQLRLGLIVRF